MRCSGVRRSARVGFAASALLSLAVWAPVVRAEMPDWWNNPAIREPLRLTGVQVAAIDRVHRDSLAERKRLRENLDRLEDRFAAMLQEGSADEHAAIALVEKMEQARARRNIARGLMLLKMHSILTVEQRALLRKRSEAAAARTP